jgi:hypothetical protein
MPDQYIKPVGTNGKPTWRPYGADRLTVRRLGQRIAASIAISE